MSKNYPITIVSVLFIVSGLFACNKVARKTSDPSGVYKEVIPLSSGSKATLKINHIDGKYYEVTLQSETSVAKMQEGLLTGTMHVPLVGTLPFNFHMEKDNTGILRIKNKIIVFKKV